MAAEAEAQRAALEAEETARRDEAARVREAARLQALQEAEDARQEVRPACDEGPIEPVGRVRRALPSGCVLGCKRHSVQALHGAGDDCRQVHATRRSRATGKASWPEAACWDASGTACMGQPSCRRCMELGMPDIQCTPHPPLVCFLHHVRATSPAPPRLKHHMMPCLS